MNYLRIHDEIIASRKISHPRLKTIHQAKRIASQCKSHAHHILPRCMGGTDSGENLVILTPREHFIVHKLLWKIHGGKMALALFYMSNTDNHDGVLSSRQYELVHREAMEARRNSEWMQNNINAAKKRSKDPGWLRKNRESVMKTTSSPEWRDSIINGVEKRSKNPDWLNNTRAATKLTVKTEKWINNHRAGMEAMKARKDWPEVVARRAKNMTKNESWQKSKRTLEVKNCKPVIGFNINNGNGVVLLGTKEKREFPINPADICACMSGRQKTAKGHTWRYATYEEVEQYRPGHEWLQLNKPT